MTPCFITVGGCIVDPPSNAGITAPNMTTYLIIIGLCIISYLLGSIPFGVLIGKMLKGIDIRTTGSGNIGTSNAFRALGPIGGSLVFLADTLKGSIPVLIIAFLVPKLIPIDMKTIAQIAVGICAILGHTYSIFLKFTGGKGVATSFGVIVSMCWYVALICLGIWGIVVLTTKISSVASMTGAIAFPITTYIFFKTNDMPLLIFSIVACLLIIYLHRSNIKRLINGEELKMSTKEKKNVSEFKEQKSEKEEDKK